MASAFPALRAPPALVRWWAGKATNERRIVAAIIAVIVVAVGWLAIWQPAQRDLVNLRVSVPAEHRALINAQRMVDEVTALTRAPAVPPAADPRSALERVLGQHGLRSAATEINWQDSRARIVFAAVGFDALTSTLEALQRETGLRIVEATLTARIEPGNVRAELVLAR